MFKKLFLILLIAITIIAGIAAMQPAHFHIERSVTIAAPASDIFPHVNTTRAWNAWSPWAKIDPNAVMTYAGPESGVGASYTWVGNDDIGEGRSTIMESRQPELIRFKLEMFQPMEATNNVLFTFKPQGDQTVVTWSMDGEKNFIAKVFGLFMDCDKMVGGDFEKGLAQLKAIAASPKAPQ